MHRQRAQAIIIRNSEVLFGVENVNGKQLRHYFIGGGIESGESPEAAVIREINEETKADGNIIFKLSKEYVKDHHTFLVDIGKQKVTLGYDPEEVKLDKKIRALQQLEKLKRKLDMM